MTRFCVALLFLFTLISCDETTPISITPTSNSEIKIGLLFEHEGCRIYRFRDDDHFIYYANCGTHVQTSWERRVGKHEEQEAVSTSEEIAQ